MINHIITEYEKQLSNLKEMKNKIVSNDLFESEVSENKDIPISVSLNMD